MTAPVTRKRGPGRASKRDELAQFAEYAGIDPEKVGEFVDAALPPPPKSPPPPKPPEPDAPPESWAEWEEELMKILWVNRRELKGVAMVQALKAIATLADHQRAREQAVADDASVSILDRLDALPPAHAVQMLRRELERNEQLRAEMLAALENLEAE